MKVVAFFSQFANGKDTAADYLATKIHWKRSAFANAVKNVFENAFGVDREFVEEWKRIDEPPPGMLKPVRQSLQFIGDGFRQIKADIWIEIALRDEGTNTILSDGRYVSNEAGAVRQKNGINVVLWRPGFVNGDPNPSESQILEVVQWCLDTDQDGVIDHARTASGFSDDIEEKVGYFDLFLRNDKDVPALYEKIDNVLIPFVKSHYALASR